MERGLKREGRVTPGCGNFLGVDGEIVVGFEDLEEELG